MRRLEVACSCSRRASTLIALNLMNLRFVRKTMLISVSSTQSREQTGVVMSLPHEMMRFQ